MREPSLPSLFAICERLRQLAYVTAAILDDVDFVTVVYRPEDVPVARTFPSPTAIASAKYGVELVAIFSL
jgi:hypothetical protein